MAWGLLGVVPVAVAAALVWLPGPRLSLDGLRAVAAGSALAVVLGALLPEAVEGGAVALVAFVLGLVLPVVIERLTQGRGDRGFAVAALVAHQVFDGLQLGALGDTLGAAGAMALGFHGAPLVAAAMLTAMDHRRRAGLLGAVLVGATVLGVVAASQVPAAWLHAGGAWLPALVGGILLHVVVHFVVHALRGPYRPSDALGLGLGAVGTFLVLAWI